MGALPYHNKLTRDRIAAADGRFNRIRQVTPICLPMWSHWRHLANAIEIVHNDTTWRIYATWRIWLNLCFIRPTRIYNPNGISIGSAVFAQMTAEVSLYFTMGRPFPPQNCLFPWGIWTLIWFPGPTWILNANGISIGSAVFAGLTSVNDRPTERPTDHATRSVTIDRIYVRSTGDAV